MSPSFVPERARAWLATIAIFAAACSDTLPPPPTEVSIEPSSGPIGVATPVTIRAKNLTQFAKANFSAPKESDLRLGFRITVGDFDVVEPRLVERDTVLATVPAFPDTASLDVVITDQYGRKAFALAAFTVRNLTCSDADMGNGVDCDYCEAMAGCVCDNIGQCVPVCGDGVPRFPEGCDDGNSADGDGCTITCTEEQGYECTGTPSVCSPICSDGVIVRGEGCDDANQIAGDGCSGSCSVEPGWTCTSSAGAPSMCSALCGDGIRFPEEPCDDGDLEAGDGCSPECSVEDGFTCDGSPSICVGRCGDGNVDNEDCDDGDLELGDGCDQNCQTEQGFVCSGEPSVCSPVCGDGFVRGLEECDDVNTNNDDGCSPICQIEPSWTCSGEPSLCTGLCGDGELRGAEPCDDMNLLSGDGCSATCEIEQGYLCPNAGVLCEAICGDGLRRGDEACDDQNLDAFDGCNSTCDVETGFLCPTEGQSCVAICGDGLVLGAEACDDGATAPGDGCSNSCTIEQGYSCPTANAPCVPVCGDGFLRGAEICDDNNLTSGDGCSNICTVEDGYRCLIAGQLCTPICGDSRVLGAETCDDGNPSAGDGCSAACTIELGYACGAPGTLCAPICGDALVRGSEACDDGDLFPNDGCSATCAIELGFVCPTQGADCVPICGDSMLRGGETCDDGNMNNLDGCSAVCATEPGFNCFTPGQQCTAICGDSLLVAGEGCDDGNLVPGDGCSATCTPEVGFNCSLAGVACTPICGDALLRGAEECDDGNSGAGDGCSAICRVEPTYSCSGIPSSCVAGACSANVRVNLSNAGVQGDNIVAQFSTDLSEDGSRVAFASFATNLVAGDNNARWDVFVRDLPAGTTELVSVSSAGVLGNGDSGSIGVTAPGTTLQEVSISGAGRYVAFVSRASNLVNADGNGAADVFLRDRVALTTTRISVSSAGEEQLGDASGRGADNAVISANGRYVAFTSWAANLVAGDTNNVADVFLRDTVAGTTERVSISAIAGQEPNAATFVSAISPDGRYVVFYGNAGNVVPNAIGGVFLRDRRLGTTELVSRASGANGTPANGGYGAEITPDGRYVLFVTPSAGVVPNDTNQRDDIFVRDRQLLTTVRVSVDANGNEGTTTNVNGPISRHGTMSDDGRFVAFQTYNNFDPVNDLNATYDVYLKDLSNGSLRLISRTAAGPAGDNNAVRPRLSANGWYLVFESDATNLLPPDVNASDLYRFSNCP